MKKVLYTLSIAFIGGISALSISLFIESKSYNPVIIESVTPNYQLVSQPSAKSGLSDFTYAAKISTPAVVHIKSYRKIIPDEYKNPFWQFFGETESPLRENPIQAGSGSGVIVSPNGYIITNNHVIGNADEISISMNDNKLYTAKIVGTYPPADLALLKIDATNLPFLEFGNYDDLDVGEWILAVGNPFNLTSTVTAGIVSAKARDINIIESTYAIESFIQTDAAVNPGNSGGALVNLEGKLVGINTAILSKTGSYAGYSFAIPVTIVEKVYNDIKDFGVVQRGLIGVSIQSVDAALIEKLKLKTSTGVYIKQVIDGAAAAAAGIKTGDVIIKINSAIIKKTAELQEELSKYRPNDKIRVTVNRDGEIKVMDVVLRNIDGSTAMLKKIDLEGENIFGAFFKEASNMEKSKLGIKQGVKIIRLEDGAFKDAKIQPGFIITHVERLAIKNSQHLVQLLKAKQKGSGVLLQGVYSNGRTAYYGIGI
ncbi:MAG: trypsin-like peptidase domain-containing protein [Flavobacteriales bacterium]|nr:trypsin-like peptidase domain-containing protein [Flavobacteriales bacterium]